MQHRGVWGNKPQFSHRASSGSLLFVVNWLIGLNFLSQGTIIYQQPFCINDTFPLNITKLETLLLKMNFKRSKVQILLESCLNFISVIERKHCNNFDFESMYDEIRNDFKRISTLFSNELLNCNQKNSYCTTFYAHLISYSTSLF